MLEFEMQEASKLDSQPVSKKGKNGTAKKLGNGWLNILLLAFFLGSIMVASAGCDLGTYTKRLKLKRSGGPPPPAETSN